MKIAILLLISNISYGWTLAYQNAVGFPTNEITVNIASTSCANAGFDTSTLKEYTEEAIEQFWNSATTSAITLKIGNVISTDINGDTTAGAVATKASANTVLIGCNDDATSFGDGFTQGVGSISCSSSTCRGGVILNARADTTVDTNSKAETLALIAHEIGHAIGLGHSSVEEALMYYSLSGKVQEHLHQDDINGITWLYPNEKEVGGLMGSCGTIDTTPKGPKGGHLNFAILLMALAFGTSLLKNQKRFMR